MGRSADCLKKVLDLGGIKKSDATSLFREVEEIIKGSKDSQEVRQRTTQFLEDIQKTIEQEKVSGAEDLLKRKERFAFYNKEDFDGDFFNAIRAKITGSRAFIEGAGDSAEATMNNLLGKYQNNLFIEMEKRGVWDLFKAGRQSRETARAIRALDDQVETKRLIGAGKITRESIEIAKVIQASNRMVVRDMRIAGADIEALPDYLFKQTHEREKIRDAGFEEWAKFIVSRLDQKRTFHRLETPAERQEYLQQIYNNMLLGKYDIANGRSSYNQFGPKVKSKNTAKDLAESRVLIFKDADSFMDYNDRFGKETMAESIMSAFEANSRNIALMRGFGTNPRKAFEQDLKGIERILSSDPEKLAKFKGQARALENRFKELEGTTSVTGFGLVTRTLRGARKLNNMSKLGGAALASVTDWTTSAAILRSVNGKNLLQNQLDLSTDYFKSLKSSERQKWAARLGIATDDLLGAHYQRFGSDDAGPGVLSKAQRLFFKMNGLEAHTEAGRVAMSKQMAMFVADNASKSFDELKPNLQETLKAYSIGDVEWRLVRQAIDDVEGTKIVTPEAMERISDIEFETALRSGGQLPGKASKAKVKAEVDRLRFELGVRIGNLYSDLGKLGIPQPGAEQRAILLQGTIEGTPLGNLLRMVTQFKSFPMTMHAVFEKIALADPLSRPKNLREALFKGKGDMVGMASFIVNATALGYVGMVARDAANNKTPSDPTRVETWKQAAVRGGAGGLYADFLFSESARFGNSLSDQLAGPVLGGLGNDVFDVYSRAINGDKFAGKALKVFMSNVPGQNLFYTKTAMDYMIRYSVQESMNPGYLRRLEGRTRQDGQEFLFFRPTDRR